MTPIDPQLFIYEIIFIGVGQRLHVIVLNLIHNYVAHSTIHDSLTGGHLAFIFNACSPHATAVRAPKPLIALSDFCQY